MLILTLLANARENDKFATVEHIFWVILLASSNQSSIIKRIDTILRGDLSQRLPQLKQLLARARYVKDKRKRTVFPQARALLEGLCEYLDAYDKLQEYHISRSRSPDSSFEEEIRTREKVIGKAGQAIYFLQKSKNLAKETVTLESDRQMIESTIDWHLYLANNLRRRQNLILHMNDLEYRKARPIAKEGLDLAKKQKGARHDVKFYAGNLIEIDAFEKFHDKKFWEVRILDFQESASLFEKAVSFLEGCAQTEEDLETMTFVPKAWSYLLRFVANPSLENLAHLFEYRKLSHESLLVKRHFEPHKLHNISKRRRRAIEMHQFFRNRVTRIACWNIFSALHNNINLVETFVNENKDTMLKMFMATEIPEKRLSRYADPDIPMTFEYFIDDIKNYLNDFLPQMVRKKDRPSLVVAKDLYYFCKHEPIEMNLFAEKDKFAEDFIEKALEEYKSLERLNIDVKRFLKRLRREMERFDRVPEDRRLTKFVCEVCGHEHYRIVKRKEE